MMKLLNSYNLLILERHLDSFGHVNNASYLEIYEEARWDLMDQHGHGIKQIKEQKQGPIVINIDLAFRAELIAREKVVVELYFDKMKNKKVMGFHQKILKENGTIASSMNIDMGILDTVERKLLVPSNDWWRVVGMDGFI